MLAGLDQEAAVWIHIVGIKRRKSLRVRSQSGQGVTPASAHIAVPSPNSPAGGPDPGQMTGDLGESGYTGIVLLNYL